MTRLIGLDWGTSHLRAYLFGDDGTIADARQRPWGLRSLPEGGFDAALAAITDGWPRGPRLACGMVGARGGWHEMPYLDTPADVAALARALECVRAADGAPVHLVPGLRDPRRPDVMRGEETQILGAIARMPALAARATLLLPGTHSKWAEVEDGRVSGFRTAMTGELYALLRAHSILGAGLAADAGADDAQAFLHGVREARDSGAAGALTRIFTLRARMLDGSLAGDALPAHLSGLLIGEELRGMFAVRSNDRGGVRGDDHDHAPASMVLVGDPTLCARYRQALECFGRSATLAPDEAAAHGLWRIARDAGLLDAAHAREARA